MPVLEAQNLSRWYGDVIALNDLTLQVQGGITGLLGPNGAGKSTLIQIAVGLLKPSSGALRVLDEKPWANTRLLRKIGYVSEADAPWRDLTGRRAAVLSARLTGLTGPAAETAVAASLQRVGLSDVADKPVQAYSRGMRQRLKIALALTHDPELYILDEPLLGVDPLTRRDLITLIRDVTASGRSVLVSTHVLPDVEAMTSRILLLNHGRLMAYGDIADIRNLLERYPRTIRIASPNARELGAELWNWSTVRSLQVEDHTLIVRTGQPAAFFQELQKHLLQNPWAFTSITSPDDSVEAVFKYLVGER